MTYDQLKALGIDIDRGALAPSGAFKEDMIYSTVGVFGENMVDRSVPAVAPRPEPGEDLSALNPKHSRRNQEAARALQRARLAADPDGVRAKLAAAGKRNPGKARIQH